MFEKTETYRRAESTREKVRFIYSSSYRDLLVNSIAFLVLVAVFCPLGDHAGLLIWIAFNAVAIIYRFGLILWFRRMLLQLQEEVGSYIWLFWGGVLFSGLVFGSAGFVLFPQSNLSHQIFLAIVLWGVSAISTGYYAPSLGVSVTYTLFMALPVTLKFFVSANEHELHIIAGLLGIVYLAVQCIFSIKINRYFTDNLSLQLDNMELTKEFAHEVKSRIAAEKIAKDCHCQ